MSRTLTLTRPFEHGPDVAEIQRLLGVDPADGVYGHQTANAVYRRKVELGFKTPNHEAGATLLAYLSGRRKPSAAMAARAKASASKVAPAGSSSTTPPPEATHEDRVRAGCVELFHLLVAHAASVHYPAGDKRTRSIRAITTRLELELLLESSRGLTIDCSQTVTLVAHVAGARCPNGGYAAHWADDGYTGTLLDGCARITASQARPGDLRVYGGGTGHHVGMVLEPGLDPLIGSQGSEAGPFILRDSAEQRYQPAGGTFLRLPI